MSEIINREEGKGKPPRLYPKTGYLLKRRQAVGPGGLAFALDIQNLLIRAEHQNNNKTCFKCGSIIYPTDICQMS